MKHLTDEQIKFIELYSFEKMKYEKIEEITGWSRKHIQNLRNIKAVDEKINDIQKVRNKFTNIRQEGFENNGKTFKDFYSWYKKEDAKGLCGYCGVTQTELMKLFAGDETRVLPYLSKDRDASKRAKRSSGSLEIERLNSAQGYGYGEDLNIILACPLCNNAKSNLIDEDSWVELFVPAMNQYYKKLLSELK